MKGATHWQHYRIMRIEEMPRTIGVTCDSENDLLRCQKNNWRLLKEVRKVINPFSFRGLHRHKSLSHDTQISV